MQDSKNPKMLPPPEGDADIDLDELPRNKIFSRRLKREIIAKKVAAIRGEALQKGGLTTQNIYRQIGAMANSDIRQILCWKTPVDDKGVPGPPLAFIKDSSELTDDIALAIKEMTITGGGKEIRVVLYDKIQANKLAAQIKGLMKPAEADDRPSPLIMILERTQINPGGIGRP